MGTGSYLLLFVLTYKMKGLQIDIKDVMLPEQIAILFCFVRF